MNLKLEYKNNRYYPLESDLLPTEQTLWFFLDDAIGNKNFINMVYEYPEGYTGGNQASVQFIGEHLLSIEDDAFNLSERNFTIDDKQYEKLMLSWKQILQEKPEEVEITEDNSIYSIIGKFNDGRIVDYGEKVKPDCKLE